MYLLTFHLTLFSFALGPTDNLFSAHMPKNLTPSLLKTRQRFETVSAGSATTDTEDCISPLWESEEVSDICVSNANNLRMLIVLIICICLVY